MSLSYSLGAIRMLLGEPNPQVRSTFRSGLFGAGLRGIEDSSSGLRTLEMVSDKNFDLIVLDADMEDTDIIGMIRSLREKRMGPDPFTNIILIADPPVADRARRLVSAGADAVLIRPISVQLLQTRINQLIESRRPFVVTQDYIGPERRTEQRPGAMPIPTIPVPSSLKSRAFGKTDDNLHMRAVTETWDIIKRERITRLIYQIGWLANRILPLGSKDDAREVRSQFIRQLGLVVNSLDEWISDTHNAEFYSAYRQIKEKVKALPQAEGAPLLDLINSICADAAKLDELWKSGTKAGPS
jgi:CheY-like chemotaxis protein